MRGRAGHSISIKYVDRADLSAESATLDSVFDAGLTGVVIRNALPAEMVVHAAGRLQSQALESVWKSPNKGMPGGEIRTICDAATPTFTALRGPTREAYAQSASEHLHWTQSIFGEHEPTIQIASIFSDLFHGHPAAPPSLGAVIIGHL